MANQHPNLTPYQPFATSDGNIIIAVGNERQLVEHKSLSKLDDVHDFSA